MTNTELIRQEIERLQEFNNSMSKNAINSNMRNFYDGEEDCCKQLLSFIDSLQQEKPMENIATSAANDWCRCFKCDKIVNETGLKCEKPSRTCLKWYDAYKGAMIALEKLNGN